MLSTKDMKQTGMFQILIPDKEFCVDFRKDGEYEIYLLDDTHDSSLVGTKKELDFKLKPNSCIMIKEI